MLVVTNNWRVMHGRSSFDGKRRLVGCYVGMYDFLSRIRELTNQQQQIPPYC